MWAYHRQRLKDLAGALHKSELMLEFLDPDVRLSQGLALS